MRRAVSVVGFLLILACVALSVPWSWSGVAVFVVFALVFAPR